jgi:hypothetical protein
VNRWWSCALAVAVACSGSPKPETAAPAVDTGESEPVPVTDTDEHTEDTAGGTSHTEETGDTEPPPEVEPDVVPSIGWPSLVSPARGVFVTPLEVVVERDDGAGVLRFTTDGTDPSGEWGVDYVGPIPVVTTTVLRLALVLDGVSLWEETHTYVFPADVPTQAAPETWPTEWWLEEDGGPYPADYGMDAQIVDDPRYVDLFPDVFTTLPIASLSLDPEDLFGEAGIHEHPIERGEEWERSASFELFNYGDSAPDVGVRCGARIQGGAARSADKTPKKSFRVLFKSDYGPSKLEYPVFEGSDVERFDTLVLRSRYNRSWANWQDLQRERSQYVRERFGLDTHREMGALASRGQHVHLFLNGLYWGVYLLEERPDGSFHSEHVGGDKDDWDVLNSGEPVDGDRVAWDDMMARVSADLSDPGAYSLVQEVLDVEAFADYMLLNIGMGNIDWPEKNWYAARYRADGELWRFLIWDFELTIVNTTDNLFGVDDADTPGAIFQSLRTNEDFRVLFGDRVQRHIVDGGALGASANIERFASIASMVVPGVVAESARWGDHWRDDRLELTDLYTYDDHWLPEYDRVVDFYLPTRELRLLEQLVDEGLYPAVAPPAAALADDELMVELSAGAGEIYITVDGTDPRAPGGAIGATATAYAAPVPVGKGLELKARVRDDGEWSALVERSYAP